MQQHHLGLETRQQHRQGVVLAGVGGLFEIGAGLAELQGADRAGAGLQRVGGGDDGFHAAVDDALPDRRAGLQRTRAEQGQHVAGHRRIVADQASEHTQVRRRPGRRRVAGVQRVAPVVRRRRQPFRQHRLERVQLDRLGHVVIHAGVQAASCFTLHGVGGQRDDGQAGLARGGSRLADTHRGGQFVAVHLRHVQVGQQQVVVGAAGGVQGLLAVADDVGLEAEQRQLLAQHLLVDLVVLGDQDALAAVCRTRCVQRRRHRVRPLPAVGRLARIGAAGGQRHRAQEHGAAQALGVEADDVGRLAPRPAPPALPDEHVGRPWRRPRRPRRRPGGAGGPRGGDRIGGVGAAAGARSWQAATVASTASSASTTTTTHSPAPARASQAAAAARVGTRCTAAPAWAR